MTVPDPASTFHPESGQRSAISVRGLKKSFGGAALYNGLDLDFPKGRFVSIFGPNGCGKSTLINMIAGLIPIDGGQILFDGRNLKDATIGYVFQNYRDALFPWMSARANIEYPLKVRGWARERIDARVDELIAQFDVGFDLRRHSFEMSGGQQQLVSILRALAPKPEVMFLDEPFSALDYEMTLFIRERIQSVFMQTGVTMILVSHDLEEAVYLADRVLLLTKRPTHIAEIIDVPLSRPRREETLSDAAFITLKARSLAIFQREVRR